MTKTRPSPLTQLLDVDSPDPAVLVTDAGIHLFTSQMHLATTNIEVYRAPRWQGPWQHLGGALTETGIGGANMAEHWAPDDPIRVGDRYRMYYTAGPFGTSDMGLAMAESAGDLTNFRPVQQPVLPILTGNEYADIDPRVIEFEGDYYLFYGSMKQAIRYVKLAPDGYEAVTAPQAVLWPSSEHPFMDLLEGFYLRYHPQHQVWFAFTSGNNTWVKDDYAITLFTGPTPFGPFERLGLLLEPDDEWWAPGQNSIAEIVGEWYLVCHAVDPRQPYVADPVTGRDTGHFRRVTCVARMTFPAGQYPELEKIG